MPDNCLRLPRSAMCWQRVRAGMATSRRREVSRRRSLGVTFRPHVLVSDLGNDDRAVHAKRTSPAFLLPGRSWRDETLTAAAATVTAS